MKPTFYAGVLSIAVLAGCSDTNSPPTPAFTRYETLGDSVSIAAKLTRTHPCDAGYAGTVG